MGRNYVSLPERPASGAKKSAYINVYRNGKATMTHFTNILWVHYWNRMKTFFVLITLSKIQSCQILGYHDMHTFMIGPGDFFSCKVNTKFYIFCSILRLEYIYGISYHIISYHISNHMIIYGLWYDLVFDLNWFHMMWCDIYIWHVIWYMIWYNIWYGHISYNFVSYIISYHIITSHRNATHHITSH